MSNPHYKIEWVLKDIYDRDKEDLENEYADYFSKNSGVSVNDLIALNNNDEYAKLFV